MRILLFFCIVYCAELDYGIRYAFVPFSLRCHGHPSKEIRKIAHDGGI